MRPIAFLMVAPLVLACFHKGGGTESAPSCVAVQDACAAVTTAGDLAAACRDLGLWNVEADCAAGLDACEPACAAAEGGHVDPPATCSDYCSCMTETCATEAGYAFADEEECLSQCQGYTAEELSCWSSSCVQATVILSYKTHLCEHAWGLYGRMECE